MTLTSPNFQGDPFQSSRKWGIKNYNLVLGRIAFAPAYKVMISDLAAQAEQYSKLVYLICAGEDDHLQPSSMP
jgi:hypothetical protein